MNAPTWCLGLLLATAPVLAAPPEAPPRQAPLVEIPDAELGVMRGRYVVGNDLVAWFGVTMTSVWQTASGQTLQGTLQLGMDFAQGGMPVLSFEPTVSITASDAPLPATAGATVDASGLANVSGLVQSVQVAGDGNAVRNVTALRVRESGAPAAVANASGGGTASATAPGMQATAGVVEGRAQVLLQVDGHGLASQWLRPGSAGQSVQLTANGQQIQNQLQIDLVRQSLPATANLQRDVAQAIGLHRSAGI